MQPADVASIVHAAFMVTLKMGGPPLLAALIAGLVMSLVQAVTQINEPTLAFIPKITLVLATLAALGSFMAMTLLDYGRLVFDQIVAVGGA